MKNNKWKTNSNSNSNNNNNVQDLDELSEREILAHLVQICKGR